MKFEEKAQLWYELNCALAILERQFEDGVDTPMHNSAIKGIKTVLPLVKNFGETNYKKGYQKPHYQTIRSAILDKNNFAGYWASLLAEKGVTQAEVGYALGISQQSVSDWKARCRIPTKHYAKICDFLSLSDEESEKLKSFYFESRGHS